MLKHKWDITETIDTCTNCGLKRRNAATMPVDSKTGFRSDRLFFQSREYFINNEWVQLHGDKLARSCPSQNQNK